jgi:hypothetical protein
MQIKLHLRRTLLIFRCFTRADFFGAMTRAPGLTGFKGALNNEDGELLVLACVIEKSQTITSLDKTHGLGLSHPIHI